MSRGIPANGREAYFTQGYLNEGRFVDYHYAYRLAMDDRPSRVLEIGPGNGLLSWLLRKSGCNVTTLDIDPSVCPDVLGSVEAVPFRDSAFDAVVCVEVLEHLPLDSFAAAMKEIRRVTRRRCVLSLPHVGRYWMFLGQLPLVGNVCGSIHLPQLHPPDFTDHPEHYWSIGTRGASDRKIDRSLMAAGFIIRRSFRPLANKCHKFFLLEVAR
ncbi:MAG: methyltransferase domain-containing protein [bacterium]